MRLHTRIGTLPLTITNNLYSLCRCGEASPDSRNDEYNAYHFHDPPEHALMMYHSLFSCTHLRARLGTRRPVVPRRAPDVRARKRVRALRPLVVSPWRRTRVFAGPGRGSMRVVVIPGIGRAAPPADVVRPMGVGVVVPMCVSTCRRAGALSHRAVVCSPVGSADERKTFCME